MVSGVPMLDVFISYSHKDEEFRERLEVHLAMLKRQWIIRIWNDRRIGAGKINITLPTQS